MPYRCMAFFYDEHTSQKHYATIMEAWRASEYGDMYNATVTEEQTLCICGDPGLHCMERYGDGGWTWTAGRGSNRHKVCRLGQCT